MKILFTLAFVVFAQLSVSASALARSPAPAFGPAPALASSHVFSPIEYDSDPIVRVEFTGPSGESRAYTLTSEGTLYLQMITKLGGGDQLFPISGQFVTKLETSRLVEMIVWADMASRAESFAKKSVSRCANPRTADYLVYATGKEKHIAAIRGCNQHLPEDGTQSGAMQLLIQALDRAIADLKK